MPITKTRRIKLTKDQEKEALNNLKTTGSCLIGKLGKLSISEYNTTSDINGNENTIKRARFIQSRKTKDYLKG